MTTTTKISHTPGPWTVGKTNGDWHVWAPGTPWVAVIPLRDVSINEQQANAHLVSASPDMLETLKEFLLCGENAGHNQDLLARVKSAINKAEGSQP